MPDDINRSSTPGQGAAVTPPPPSGAPVPPPGAPAPVSTDPVEAGPGGDTEEAAKQEASKVADTAKDQASQVAGTAKEDARSEEHTSELQSRGHLVCRLLLEKKKKVKSKMITKKISNN